MIIELNTSDLNKAINNLFPFISHGLTVPYKKGLSVESMESILVNNNYTLNYYTLKNTFEDDFSYDHHAGLIFIQELFFQKVASPSDILFFTPTIDTHMRVRGFIIPSDKLLHFLLHESCAYYKFGLDITDNDLYFYHYAEKKFYGVEHSCPPWWVSV
ncbi:MULTISPECIES: hypothetical protein [Escherichia]|nr:MULTISPECIES: hypothetical protein [Escherichia]MCU8645001.1 hypothetical protein [Escherichia coli]EHG6004085.1 hypothetical protein [Escherichia fergusonii]EHK3040003.1 hypothetical protein [Escherichia fergusonii]EHU9788045.1 hypothetical protein [Escherichia fergusonii]MBY7517597.1 hypothetical protein [Escherichia fergusonii]